MPCWVGGGAWFFSAGRRGAAANGLEIRSCFRRAGLIEAPLVSYCYINEVF
jgi:hypothetical protein